MKFTKLLKVAKFKAIKNAPSLLVGAGIIVGAGALVATAIQSTKLHDILDEAKEEMENRDNAVKESKKTTDADGNVVPYDETKAKEDKRAIYIRTIIKLVKLYALPAGLSALSIMLILKGNKVAKTRLAESIAAYNGLFAAYNAARNRATEVVGADKARDIFNGITRNGDKGTYEEVNESTGEVTSIKHENGTANGNDRWTFIFSSETSSLWSCNHSANQLLFTAQDNDLNRLLELDGAVLVNQALRHYGIKPTKNSMVDGWIRRDLGGKDGYIQVEKTLLDRDSETYLIEFNIDGNISNQYETAMRNASKIVVPKKQW